MACSKEMESLISFISFLIVWQVESTDLQGWTASAEEVGEEKQNKYSTIEKSFSFI